MAASNVFGSMPSSPPTGNGIYDVTATSGPYSQKLRAVDRVGTAQYPFLPSCQPAYIPVLYRNVGTINDTLIDINTTVSGHTTTLGTIDTTVSGHTTTLGTIDTTVSGHTTTLGTINTNIGTINTNIGTIDTTVSGHTTTLGTINTSIGTINTSIGTANIAGGSITAAIAVLQSASSVASSGCSTQFLGITPIGDIAANDISTVDVSSNTTVISSISPVSTSVRATYTYTNGGGEQNPDAAIAIYEMAAYDLKEFGCSKTVMFTAADWVNVNESTDVPKVDLGQLAFLYAGTGNYFLVNGSKQNFYQFSFIGDFVTFQMLPDTGGGWLFVVTNHTSILSTTISLNNAQASVNVTDETLRALIVTLQ